MTNIWQFFLFTLTCSAAAAFILVIKQIFNDKLSPRWQYGVWAVLALRLLLPVGVKQSFMLPFPLWTEMLKSICEKHLSSAFSSEFQPLSDTWLLPMIKASPKSITDWLFALYAAGVFVFLLWHIISYLRLRRMLRKGGEVSDTVKMSIQRVSGEYGLKPCRAVSVKGLGSAFVCGVFRPVLAVPEGAETDDKIILHELLHLKHYDALQSIIWCVFRAVHWCNPFMHYVFDRISNDMEALCDQRVLERLEGEERRQYGVILLSMANEKYARAPGTTSVSNGGRNISQRIEAIVRFKKYPKGMALVSLCIIVFSASVILSGSSYTVSMQDMTPVEENELHRAMAVVRINRCGTLPGALDTYAKGLMLENGVYIAAASPLDTHEELAQEMLKSSEDGWVAYHIDVWDDMVSVDKSSGYMVYNIEPQNGGYTAYISLRTYGEYNEETYEYETGTVLIPVSVRYENGWVVRETGPWQVYDHTFNDTMLPCINVFEVQGETGTVRLGLMAEYEIGNTAQDGFFNNYFDETPKLNASFSSVMIWNRHEYDMNTKTIAASPQNYAGFEIIPLEDLSEKYEFTDLGAGSGATSGYGGWSTEWVDDNWDGTIRAGGGGGWGGVGAEPVELPKAYAVQIVWDGETVEEFLLTEENK